MKHIAIAETIVKAVDERILQKKTTTIFDEIFKTIKMIETGRKGRKNQLNDKK